MKSPLNSIVRTIGTITILIGLWLLVSPTLLGYATTASVWNQTLVGAVVVGLTIWHLFDVSARWVSWVNVIAGIWLVFAPFALGYTALAAYINGIVTAGMLSLLAFSSANVHRSERK